MNSSGSELYYNFRKLELKRQFRKNLTPAEQVLWQALRNRKLLGTKWRRQANIDMFIADFLCVKYRIIVEIDGEIHEQQKEYDHLRTEVLRDHDYRVIRFTNDEVLKNLTSVLQQISKVIRQATKF